MQDEIEISCPKCHSLDVKFCFEQKTKRIWVLNVTLKILIDD